MMIEIRLARLAESDALVDLRVDALVAFPLGKEDAGIGPSQQEASLTVRGEAEVFPEPAPLAAPSVAEAPAAGPAAATTQETTAPAEATVAAALEPAPERKAEAVEAEPVAQAAEVTLAEPQAPAAPTAPAPSVAPTAATAPAAPTPEPISEVRKEQLESIVETAGLEWVETKPTQLTLEEVPVPLARPQRQRKPRPAVADEPLLQVETRPGEH